MGSKESKGVRHTENELGPTLSKRSIGKSGFGFLKSQSSFAKQIQNSWHILTNRNPAVWLSINIFTDSRNLFFGFYV